jgi:hypothetical protein
VRTRPGLGVHFPPPLPRLVDYRSATSLTELGLMNCYDNEYRCAAYNHDRLGASLSSVSMPGSANLISSIGP